MLYRLGLAALAVIAVLARTHQLGHTLSYDEAWVANSLLSPTLAGMFFSEVWVQSTPPGFLLLSRAVIGVLGVSNLAFHALPFAAGVAAVGVVTWIGWRTLSPTRGLWIGLLAATSSAAVGLARDGKQYSVELLVTALLLALLLRVPRLAPRTAFWAPPLAMGAAFAFCPASLVFLPAAVGSLWLQQKQPARVRLAIVWTTLTGVMAAATYLAFLAPNRSPELYGFWRACFNSAGEDASLIRVPWVALRTVLADQVFGEFSGARVVRWALLLIPLAGVVAAIRARGERGRLAVLAGVPIALALAANLAGVYPLCDTRFSAFLLPGVLLLHGLAGGLLPGAAFARAGRIVLAAALAAGLVIAAIPSWWPVRSPGEFDRAMEYLDRVSNGPADLLFMHGALAEQFKLYARMHPPRVIDVAVGQTGVGCCPRNLDGDRAYRDDLFFRQEFDTVITRAAGRRIWLVYARHGNAVRILRREEPLHLEMLSAAGCRAEQSRNYTGIGVFAYRCPSAPPR